MKVTNAVLLCAALLADSTSAAARGASEGIVNRRQLLSSDLEPQRETSLRGIETPLSAPTLTPVAVPESASAVLPASSSAQAPASPSASPSEPSPSTPIEVQPNHPAVSQAPSSETSPARIPPQSAISVADSNEKADTVSTPGPSATLPGPQYSKPSATTTKLQQGNALNVIHPLISIATASGPAESRHAKASHENDDRTTDSGFRSGLTPVTDATEPPAQTSKPATKSTVGAEVAALSCSDSEDNSDCLLESLLSTTTGGPASTIISAMPPTPTEDNRSCTPFPFDKPIVQYSIVYTTTVTFYGNVSDYTPPYEPIKTPDYCTVLPSTVAPLVTPAAQAPKLSNSEPEASEALIPDLPVPLPTALPLQAVDTLLTPIVVYTSQDAAKMKGGLITVTLPPIPKILHQVVTFITTEKNPAVVFPTESAPAFSQTFLSIPDSFNPQVHKTVDDVDEEAAPTVTPGPAIPNPVNSVKLPPKPSFAVTAGGNTVIINDNTFTDLRPGQTTTVTVGPATFTLLPTAVQGMGSTITKPAPQETGMPAPTSGNVGGLPVTVSGSEAVISGITVRIPLQTTSTTTIGGHDVTLAPGTVSVGSDSLTFVATTPRPTDQVVSGGNLMTVIGRSLVVMGANTLTYGSSIPQSTTVVGGDTITIGPSGIDLRGTTLGGPFADATGTELQIVGGVTVGRLPNSRVVINGQTFTLNARGVSRTALLGGETITIRNDGLVVSSTTIAYPADAYVTATIRPTGSWIDAMPAETGSAIGRADKSAASSQPRSIFFGTLCFGIAIGVGVLF